MPRGPVGGPAGQVSIPYTYIRVLNIGGFLIWQSVGRSAKAPNLIPRQIFRLYGISNHQKGVFFDGHERKDVVVYRSDFLEKFAKLDETTKTPTQQSPCVSAVHQSGTR